MSIPTGYEEAGIPSGANRRAAAVDDLPADVLRPLLEGARARGLADALDLIGIAGVLLDSEGAVLHVGTAAAARMGGAVTVASRHLVGVDPTLNHALQEVVAAALAGEVKTVALEVPAAGRGLSARAIAMPRGWENPYQLMKALIVFEDAPKTIDEWASCD